MKDATIMLLDQLLDLIRLATTHEDARAKAWQLHGAATMAYRLGLLDVDTWQRYDETADTLIAAKLAAKRQLPLLDD
jgi:hypothetical protein